MPTYTDIIAKEIREEVKRNQKTYNRKQRQCQKEATREL